MLSENKINNYDLKYNNRSEKNKSNETNEKDEKDEPILIEEISKDLEEEDVKDLE